MSFVLSQLCGIIASIFVCWGYVVKSKPHFLIIQIIGNTLLALSFLFVSAMAGAITTFFSALRCVFLFVREGHNLNTSHYLPLFCVIYLLLGIISWQHWFDFMPIMSSILFTIAYFSKKLKVVKLLSIMPTLLILVYSCICGAYTSAMCASIELSVLIFSIIKLYTKHKQINC